MSTKIPYVSETWNVFSGCSKISDGCDNCYAEKMSFRLAEMGQEKYMMALNDDGKWAGKVYFDENSLSKPSTWKEPRMVFVNSMSDTFHNSVPFTWVNQIIETIIKYPQHTFLFLTKRPDRMNMYFEGYLPNVAKFNVHNKLTHLWLGVTAENQVQANHRVPILLRTPAAKRFVSVEPMLGPVDLTHLRRITFLGTVGINALAGLSWYDDIDSNKHNSGTNKIDWVICGAESGPKRRIMEEDWVRKLKNDCVRTNTPFFFKQKFIGCKKFETPLLDEQTWQQTPQPYSQTSE